MFIFDLLHFTMTSFLADPWSADEIYMHLKGLAGDFPYALDEEGVVQEIQARSCRTRSSTTSGPASGRSYGRPSAQRVRSQVSFSYGFTSSVSMEVSYTLRGSTRSLSKALAAVTS